MPPYFPLNNWQMPHETQVPIFIEVLIQTTLSFFIFQIQYFLAPIPYWFEGHISLLRYLFPYQPSLPLFHIYNWKNRLYLTKPFPKPSSSPPPHPFPALPSSNNIMQSNWQYRSYNLIYSHPNGSLLYLGDLASASNLNFLHSHHIHTVITAALGMDQLDYSQMHLTHLLFPLLDAKRPTASQTFQDFYDIVERQMKEGNVLVHCSAGVSRSPTLVIAYLMRKQSLSFKEAIGLVRSKGRKVMPTLGFERQLKAYEGFLNHFSPRGQERKRPSNQGRWRSSRMRFTQPQLPNLSLLPLPLHSGSFTITPSAINNIFATLISRREAATQQIRRQRIVSSDSKADTLNISSRTRRTILVESISEDAANNFEVRRALISQRTSKPKVRSKPILSP